MAYSLEIATEAWGWRASGRGLAFGGLLAARRSVWRGLGLFLRTFGICPDGDGRGRSVVGDIDGFARWLLLTKPRTADLARQNIDHRLGQARWTHERRVLEVE